MYQVPAGTKEPPPAWVAWPPSRSDRRSAAHPQKHQKPPKYHFLRFETAPHNHPTHRRQPLGGRARHPVRAAPATNGYKFPPTSPSQPVADHGISRIFRILRHLQWNRATAIRCRGWSRGAHAPSRAAVDASSTAPTRASARGSRLAGNPQFWDEPGQSSSRRFPNLCAGATHGMARF